LCATGEEAKDIATIDIAISALEIAEYLTPMMKMELAADLDAITITDSPRDLRNFPMSSAKVFWEA
jgi:hypothetical protein